MALLPDESGERAGHGWAGVYGMAAAYPEIADSEIADSMAFDTDVLVVGGGPGGLAAAIAAAGRGLDVTVADGCRPPLDKACGEGLMPNSVTALADLGVSLREAETAPFRGIRFFGSGSCAESMFPGGTGRGIRRTLLHSLLRERAEALGVRLLWQTPVTGLENERVAVGSRWMRARWIVGADGAQSRLRRWAGLDGGAIRSRRLGLRRHYRRAPWSEFVEVYWGERGQAYVTPVGPDMVSVALLGREKHVSVEAGLEGFPDLRRRLGDAAAMTPARGAVTVSRRLDRVTRGRVALVGDASGSVDAITGEGLALSFRQAASLAEALRAGDLSVYEETHRAIGRLPLFMSRALLLMDRSRLVREHTLRALERSPELFARMLRVHVGEAPLTMAGDEGILRLGWELITG